MSIVFLDGVNAVLKRAQIIAGDTQNLVTSTVTSTATGLTATEALQSQSAIQHQVDMTVQIWNEAIQEVYSLNNFPKSVASATMQLASTTREYALPTDFERFAGLAALRGATTYLVLYEYPGGYEQMLVDQPTASDFKGQPTYFAISPINQNIRVDAEPTSAEAGNKYNYLYEKTLRYTSTMATETFPFSDNTFDAMIPVVAQWLERSMKKDFDALQFQQGIVRAVGKLMNRHRDVRYGKGRAL